MRVITQLPNDLRRAQAAARAAEAAGFDGVVALENAHGPYLPLAAAALATERIQLGTAVAMAFPRSPTITAHQAWDLHLASGGRFHLGLGSQVKAHNERRQRIPSAFTGYAVGWCGRGIGHSSEGRRVGARKELTCGSRERTR
jgi:alkanesulfonate monooxygenase SsuD/methylene tetrahydromethanopterin reductase-like flavin-dependent oxidoreductase (luciferase family)